MNEYNAEAEALIGAHKAKRNFFANQYRAIQDQRPNPYLSHGLRVCVALCDYCVQIQGGYMAAVREAMSQIPKPDDYPLQRQLEDYKSQMARTLRTVNQPDRKILEADSKKIIKGLEDTIEGQRQWNALRVQFISLSWGMTNGSLVDSVFASEDAAYARAAVRKFCEFVFDTFKDFTGPIGDWLEKFVDGGQIIKDIFEARTKDALAASEQLNRIDDFILAAVPWCCMTMAMTFHLPKMGTPVNYRIENAYAEFLPDFRRFLEFTTIDEKQSPHK